MPKIMGIELDDRQYMKLLLVSERMIWNHLTKKDRRKIIQDIKDGKVSWCRRGGLDG